MTYELWKHQIQMHERMLNALDDHQMFFLLAGCGTGKTFTTYKAIESIRAKKTLVISTKAGVSGAWEQDASKFGISNVTCLYAGTVAQRIAKIKGDGIYVMGYEAASIAWKTLKTLGFDFVVFDESHKIKTHNSGVSQNLARLMLGVNRSVAMTGTGFEDKPTDVYGQVRAMSPKLSGKYLGSTKLGMWTPFSERYTVFRTLPGTNVRIPERYVNIEELSQRIAAYTMHVLSEDVLDLPPVTVIRRVVHMTSKLRKHYDELKRDLLTRIECHDLSVGNQLTAALRLHQMVGGYYKPDGIDSLVYFEENPKLDELEAIVDEIGGEPFVIFTRFKSDVKLIKERLKNHKLLELTGDKQEHVDFQAGSGDGLVANIGAGAASVNLTRARYAIYYSIGFSASEYQQSLARIRRPGSDTTRPVVYYHLEMGNSIDTLIWNALENKHDLAAEMLKGL